MQSRRMQGNRQFLYTYTLHGQWEPVIGRTRTSSPSRQQQILEQHFDIVNPRVHDDRAYLQVYDATKHSRNRCLYSSDELIPPENGLRIWPETAFSAVWLDSRYEPIVSQTIAVILCIALSTRND